MDLNNVFNSPSGLPWDYENFKLANTENVAFFVDSVLFFLRRMGFFARRENLLPIIGLLEKDRMTMTIAQALSGIEITTTVVGSGLSQASDDHIKAWIPIWREKHIMNGTRGLLVLMASYRGYRAVLKTLQNIQHPFPTVLIYKTLPGASQKLRKLRFTAQIDSDSMLDDYDNYVRGRLWVPSPIFYRGGGGGPGPGHGGGGGPGPGHGGGGGPGVFRHPLVHGSQYNYPPVGYGHPYPGYQRGALEEYKSCETGNAPAGYGYCGPLTVTVAEGFEKQIMRFFCNPRKPMMILDLARPDTKKNLVTLVKAFGECRQLANLIMRFFSNPRKPMILDLARPDTKKNLVTLVKAFGECRQLANLVLSMSQEMDQSFCLAGVYLLSLMSTTCETGNALSGYGYCGPLTVTVPFGSKATECLIKSCETGNGYGYCGPLTVTVPFGSNATECLIKSG